MAVSSITVGEIYDVAFAYANPQAHLVSFRQFLAPFTLLPLNDPDYEDILESVADSVLAALRHNTSLNGTCDYSLPVSGQWKDGMKTSLLRVFEIIEQATVLVSR